MAKAEEPRPLSGHPNRKVRTIAGSQIVFDGEGFLRNPEDWSEEMARLLAAESGLKEWGEIHWQVIRFMRAYYFQHGRAPMNRDLKAGVKMTLMDLEALFPGGIRGGARRVAGLPNPKTCAG
ncbi:TusE/DsrC/DsvC family sulfur relay protein [Desulfatiglans anilini]|uniref:TusE/DsrC/DsvC family sulfur relay protein n=1 Tax=Desulfatiglans anilini TaxID=90728 RepID=UPI000413D288|nr:TusE/DsrC/DsvC family sulfur relay protein [Desulfatiglans anilini]